MEQYGNYSGTQMSLMIIGVAFMEMLPPLALGYLTTEEHPSAFVYINLILMITCCVLCAIFMHFGSKTEKSALKLASGEDTSRSSKSQTIELELEFD
jgi:hypothetical protein